MHKLQATRITDKRISKSLAWIMDHGAGQVINPAITQDVIVKIYIKYRLINAY